jgi:two-component system response regulator DesR
MHILLADDEAKVRSALRLLLEQQDWIDGVSEVDNGVDLATAACDCQPDLLLLDHELPGLKPLADFVERLHNNCPSMSIIALSGQPEAERQALAAGVDAFVSKSEPPERLLSIVETVGGIHKGPLLTQ